MTDYIQALNRLYWQTFRHLALTEPDGAMLRLGVTREDVECMAALSPAQFETLLNAELPTAIFKTRMRLTEITRDGARMRLLLAQDLVLS